MCYKLSTKQCNFATHLLVEGEQLARGLADASQRQLHAPHLALVLQAELADELDVTMTEYYRIMDDVGSAGLLSLDEMSFGDEDDKPVPLIDTLRSQDQPSALVNLERLEMLDLLADSLGQISEQERLVVALYYYEELTLKEIGQVLELSESRVSQLHTKAVLGLRAKLRKRFMA